MTTHDSNSDMQVNESHDIDAKLSLQRRQQLSALVDGELALDQARFLLRRLGHDAELVGRWERWHLVGDVLRGQAVSVVPGGTEGVASRVAAAVATDRVAPAARTRWQHGLGVALAASVAAVALFVARPVSVDGDLPGVVATAEPAAVSVPAGSAPPPIEPVREVSVPQFAERTPARALARPDAAPMVSQSVPRISSAPDEPALALVAPGPDVTPAPSFDVPEPTTVLASTQATRPFASPREPQARPWPRAALPGLSDDAGGLTVGFGETAEAPSFYPFEPQLPAETQRTP